MDDTTNEFASSNDIEVLDRQRPDCRRIDDPTSPKRPRKTLSICTLLNFPCVQRESHKHQNSQRSSNTSHNERASRRCVLVVVEMFCSAARTRADDVCVHKEIRMCTNYCPRRGTYHRCGRTNRPLPPGQSRRGAESNARHGQGHRRQPLQSRARISIDQRTNSGRIIPAAMRAVTAAVSLLAALWTSCAPWL